eukprot:gene14890-biopygen604
MARAGPVPPGLPHAAKSRGQCSLSLCSRSQFRCVIQVFVRASGINGWRGRGSGNQRQGPESLRSDPMFPP